MCKKNYISYYFLILIFVLSSKLTFGQSNTWVKTFGDSIKDMEGECVLQTFDGGYMILVTKGSNTSDEKLMFFKLDNQGNLQWRKFILDTAINANPIKMIQTTDSGFAILGYDGTVSLNFLLKTDKNGNLVWRKNYQDTIVTYYRLYGFSKTLDNGFILTGSYTRYTPPIGEFGYIIKTDYQGNVQWQKSYRDSTNNSYRDIIQFQDSTYFVTGYTCSLSGTNYSIIKRISLNGDTISRKIFNSNTLAGFILKIQNKNIAVISGPYLNWGYYVTFFDTSYTMLDSNFFIIPEQLYSVTHTTTGNIITAGFSILQSSVGLNKISISDSSVLTKVFSYAGYNLIGATNIQTTNDGGFIITGGAQADKRYVLVIKTDSLFNAPLIINCLKEPNYISKKFELFQNYPNPFNPKTTIRYCLSKKGYVRLSIFDALGRQVETLVNENQSAGIYEASWDASNYPSGIYFYKFIAIEKETGKKFQVSKKMILLK